jgi:hypothetical protein
MVFIHVGIYNYTIPKMLDLSLDFLIYALLSYLQVASNLIVKKLVGSMGEHQCDNFCKLLRAIFHFNISSSCVYFFVVFSPLLIMWH